MAENFSVLVSAEFDNSSVNKLQSDIKKALKGEPIPIKIDIGDAEKQINSLKQQIETLSKIKISSPTLSSGGKDNNIKKSISEITQAYNDLLKIQKQYNSTKIKITGLDTEKDAKQISVLSGQLQRLQADYNNLNQAFGKHFSTDQIDNLNRVAEITGNKIDAINAKLQDTSALNKKKEEINNINADYQRLMETLKKVNATEFNLTKLKSSEGNTAQITELENKLKSLKSTYQQLYDTTNQKLSPTQMNSIIKETENAKSKLKELDAKLQDTKKKQDELLGQRRTAFNSQIDVWVKGNSAALKTFGADIERIKRELKSCDNTGLTKLKAEFREVQQQAKLAGVATQTFGDRIKSAISNIPNALTSSLAMYFNSMTLFTKVFNSIRDGISTVKDLDTALVDLQKTTTASASQLNDFFFEANDVAKKYGSTTQEIIQSAADWSRLGYSLTDSKQMAKLSSQMKSISPGMTIDEATNGMVSAMKAYGIEANQVLDGLMSKVNKIGNTAALTNSDIMVGLEHSASAMKAMGSSLEENIALFTAIQEISQNASKSSNALRSVALRVRGYNEETEELDENLINITGDVIDLTKVASNNFKGVSLFTDETQTEYKDLYQYFKEISEIYDEIAAKPRQELLEKLFGKTRAAEGAALIQNFEAAEKAMNNMANSAGSADAELATIEQSMEYKLNRLSETATGIMQNLFQRDDMKAVIDGFSNVLELLDSLTEKLGLFKTLGLGLSAALSLNNIGRDKLFSLKIQSLCVLYI